MVDRKILVVDDERVIREMLELAFGKAGYAVFSAPSAEEALDILKQESISLMFIDLGLENMNGFELCEYIRMVNPSAIIYAITGYAGLFGGHEIGEAGFDGYFAKPLNVAAIFQTIKASFAKLDRTMDERLTAVF